MLKAYYNLAKPGIVYGNAVTAAAGFFLASKGGVNFFLLVAMLVGLSLAIASSCVLNNVWDADIDAKMDRTQARAMAAGTISKTSAVIFGAVLGALGAAILLLYTNLLALGAALLGVFFYLALYTPLKRKTVHATLVGAVAGATPPVAGYVAVAGKLDTAALLLFLILIFWQMPHFYAIAVRRLEDYRKAEVPVLPVERGIAAAKVQMLVYIAAFILAAAAFTYFKYTGYVYLVAVVAAGVYWLWITAKGFPARDATDSSKVWAKKVFESSLIVLVLFSVLVAFGTRI